MQPTLEPGDQVLVFKYWPKNLLFRGQIVIVAPPTPTLTLQTGSRLFIKRVVGLAGDTITIKNSDLGDTALRSKSALLRQSYLQWYVPPQHCFVKGDSLGIDSRQWGPVPLNSIKGVIITKISRN